MKDKGFQEDLIVKCPQDVARLMKDLQRKDRENSMCIHLSARNMVVGIEAMAIGILNACTLHPREAFEATILNSAYGIVSVHNRPGGDCSPSEGNMKLVKRLASLRKILGIEVIDHIIVGQVEFFSTALFPFIVGFSHLLRQFRWTIGLPVLLM